MNWQAELSALLLAVLGGAIAAGRVWIQSKVTPEKLSHIVDLARMAVRGAEQVGIDAKPAVPEVRSDGTEPAPPAVTVEPVPVSGADKYDIASAALVAGASRLGVKLKPAEVTAFIHASLKEMHDAQALTAAS